MINYFNFKRFGEQYLITNDFGYYMFVDDETIRKLAQDQIEPENYYRDELIEKGFLIVEDLEHFISEYSPYLRDMKRYCLSGTALHIFAVTNKCNLNCIYCQAHDTDSKMDGSMTLEIGKKAIDFAMQSPNKNLTFEFQGGEPLLNFKTVKEMILYANAINKDKLIEYTIVTNLLNMTEDKLNFLVDNHVQLCTSLDGCRLVHNHNRPQKNGQGSYDEVIQKIRYIQQKGIKVNAIQTTTRFSLDYPVEIIEQYREIGINNIFLRPLTPLGMANDCWQEVGYSPEDFLSFYKKAFNHILELNQSGIHFIESHASFFLKKIFYHCSDNYMELRSPCGASTGQMSYYYDGNVYTCDEGRMLAEMGDRSFWLGNVNENTFSDAIKSPTCMAVCKSSILEAIPGCSDCVYQPYCGVCPVINYSGTNDLYDAEKKKFRCTVYKGILDILFEIIEKENEELTTILYPWVH